MTQEFYNGLLEFRKTGSSVVDGHEEERYEPKERGKPGRVQRLEDSILEQCEILSMAVAQKNVVRDELKERLSFLVWCIGIFGIGLLSTVGAAAIYAHDNTSWFIKVWLLSAPTFWLISLPFTRSPIRDWIRDYRKRVNEVLSKVGGKYSDG